MSSRVIPIFAKPEGSDLRAGVPAREATRGTALFTGPGEMRALCRNLDWSTTSLGAVADWSQSLRTIVAMLLASKSPLFLFWGSEKIQLYNDAYRVSFGSSGRHPSALGMRAATCWAPEWEIVGPQLEGVMAGGVATWVDDQPVSYERNGRFEEVFWSYGYTPVTDDDGSIGGALAICTETTARIASVAEQERLVASEWQARVNAEAARAAADARAAEIAVRDIAANERERSLQALNVERARLAFVFDQAPTFLAVMRGPSHEFTLVNAAFGQLVGRSDLLGHTVMEIFPEMLAQGFIALMDDVLATGTPFVGREMPITFGGAPDSRGDIRFVDFVYMPLIEADGTRSGIISHGSDVTANVLARREIEQLLVASEQARREAEIARSEAQAANRAKSEFLTVMSHELRTPLNAIAGYVELMQMGIRGPVTTQQRDDLARIQKSQRHLLGLINGVLTHARAEAGAVVYDLTGVSLAQVVSTSETLIAPQARAKRIVLRLSESFESCLTVSADREKLEQIVTNLLSNAVKFTAVGGSVILACARGSELEGVGTIVVTVADSGRGIAADAFERIFEPFVQVDARLTRSEEGMGLGLAISRDFARGMGGDLTVTSVLGVGSTFTLSLPMA